MLVFDDAVNESLAAVKSLPESYSNVPSSVLIFNAPALPDTSCNVLQDTTHKEELTKEFCWLRHVHGKVLIACTFDGSFNMSYSSFMLIASQRKTY